MPFYEVWCFGFSPTKKKARENSAALRYAKVTKITFFPLQSPQNFAWAYTEDFPSLKMSV